MTPLSPWKMTPPPSPPNSSSASKPSGRGGIKPPSHHVTSAACSQIDLKDNTFWGPDLSDIYTGIAISGSSNTDLFVKDNEMYWFAQGYFLTYSSPGGLTITNNPGYNPQGFNIATPPVPASAPTQRNLTIQNSGNNPILQFEGLPGSNYYILESTPLLTGTWRNLPGTPVAANGLGTVTYTVTNAASPSFYRTSLGGTYTNVFPFPVTIYIVTADNVMFSIADALGNVGPVMSVSVGRGIRLGVGEIITVNYTTLTWQFYGQ